MSNETDSPVEPAGESTTGDETGPHGEPPSRPRFAPSMERLRYWRVAGETLKIWVAVLGSVAAGLLVLLQLVLALLG